ncbi:MAG: flagellin lysine-N-methylase [Lachnospiraceae bacterium]|nr:flagellin lysine-N-methylase [Lachnospiraceae bacterium]
MEIRELDWYQDFSCIGGDCPQTCCRGWIIPLSPEDIARLQGVHGTLGLRIFAAAGGWTRGNFNQKSRQCPFWNKEGLCELQLQKGHSFIPDACQSYPRFFRNYGIFEQRTLDLSCVQAARMFTQHAGNISFHATEGEPATIPCSTNDDPEFLDDLIRVRDEMILELTGICDLVNNKNSAAAPERRQVKEPDSALKANDFTLQLDALLRRMFAFACDAQSASLGQNEAFTFCFSNKKSVTAQPQPGKPHIHLSESQSMFPLPVNTLRKLLDSSLYHPNLAYSNPKLYELCQDAFAFLASDSAKIPDFLSRHPETMLLYTGYLTYYLHQYFLRIYETYSYRRQVALGIIHLNLLFLLDVTYEKKHGSLSSEEFSQILAVYNRRAYFSDKIQDALYRIFEDAFV